MQFPPQLQPPRIDRVRWPALWGPESGVLPLQLSRRLAAHLRRYTDDEPCYFYWEIWPPDHEDMTGPKVYQGTLDDAAEWISIEGSKTRYLSPNYWWPRSRIWLVCTDMDLEYTVVA